MEQKNTLKIWQFVLVVSTMVLLLATMFMPAYRIDGKSVKNAFQTVSSRVGDWTGSKILKGLITIYTGSKISEADCESGLKDFEKERGIVYDNVETITPFAIMTHSLPDLCVGKDASKAKRNKFTSSFSDYSAVKKGYNKLRVGLIVSYIMLLLSLIFVIVSFATKLSKRPALIINSIFSLLMACWMGYLQFGLVGMLSEKVSDSLTDDLDRITGFNLVELLDEAKLTDKLETPLRDAASDIVASFQSVAFMAAFILAIIVLIVSAVSIFVGEKEGILERDDMDIDFSASYGDNMNMPYSERSYNGIQGGNANLEDVNTVGFKGDAFPIQDGPEVIPVTMAEENIVKMQPQSVVQPAPAPEARFKAVGIVQCIKGISQGTGLQLPEGKKVIVGKSPTRANLIIPEPTVSNVHCSITYQAANNAYRVIDHSTNGTFANGKRLQKGVPTMCQVGTILSLADGKNEIKLG